MSRPAAASYGRSRAPGTRASRRKTTSTTTTASRHGAMDPGAHRSVVVRPGRPPMQPILMRSAPGAATREPGPQVRGSHVEARGLTQRARSRQILQSISLDLRPGEFVAIAGGSGAGKTTLLQALAGQKAPSSGRIRHDGVELNDVWLERADWLCSAGRHHPRGARAGPHPGARRSSSAPTRNVERRDQGPRRRDAAAARSCGSRQRPGEGPLGRPAQAREYRRGTPQSAHVCSHSMSPPPGSTRPRAQRSLRSCEGSPTPEPPSS